MLPHVGDLVAICLSLDACNARVIGPTAITLRQLITFLRPPSLFNRTTTSTYGILIREIDF